MRFVRPRIVLGGLVAAAGITILIRQTVYESRASSLWADVPVLEPDHFWSWLAEENKRLQGVTRRASWGALKSQGAKASLHGNLRDDRGYLTAPTYDGFSNQFIMIANMIYISRHSNRIPILPAFVAHAWHMGGSDKDVAVSEVFDLNRLVLSLDGQSIVEVHELKQSDNEPERRKLVRYDGESQQFDVEGRTLVPGDLIAAEQATEDEIGCWNWFHHDASASWLPATIAHWTPFPHSVFGTETDIVGGGDIFRLIGFVDYDTSEASFTLLSEESMATPVISPASSLVCLDSVYWYLGQKHRWDLQAEWREGEGVWANVGKHLQFQPSLVRLADDFLRHLFGLSRKDSLPRFFAVHIRRGDFMQEWLDKTPDHYAHAAWKAIQELKQTLGVHIDHVIFTTDEQDPEWRAPLVSYGWHFVDHAAAGTAERFGSWLPTILDTIILSRASGFLGSTGSTMSIIAMRRVIDWNGGFGRLMWFDETPPEDWSWTW